jgi:hypothetical protein
MTPPAGAIPIRLVALGVVGGLCAARAAADGGGFVTCTWSDAAVHVLDESLTSLESFPAGATNPNGIATDGFLVWTAHFTTHEIVAYDFGGTVRFRWPATPALQGLELIDSTGELAVVNAVETAIDFYDPFSGALLRSIPAAAFATEGIAWDGARLWQLEPSGIHATNILTGAVDFSIPNAAAGCAAGGTGIADGGPYALVLACADGSWLRVAKADGGVLDAGDNGLDMYGLKGIPPASGRVHFFLDAGDLATAVAVAGRIGTADWDLTPHSLGAGEGVGLVVPQDAVSHHDNPVDPWTEPGSGADLWPAEADGVRFASNLSPQGPLAMGPDGTLVFATAGHRPDVTDDFIGEDTGSGSFAVISGPPAGDEHTALGLEVLVSAGPDVAPGTAPVSIRVAVYDGQDAPLGELLLETFNGIKAFVGILAGADLVIGRLDIWSPEGGSEGISSIALYETPDRGCVRQAPTETSASISDAECDACGTGTRIVADNFVLEGPATIDLVRFRGGYAPTNVPLDADRFALILRDDGNGAPANVIRELRWVAPTSRRPTGRLIADGAIDEYEYTIDLDPNETLLAGVYWAELFADTNECHADCDGDGTVGVTDFLALLGQWGDLGPCDVSGDGADVVDFLALLAHWGPCPPDDPTDWVWEHGLPDPDGGIAGVAISWVGFDQEVWSADPAADQAFTLECTVDPFDCPGPGDCCLAHGSPGCADAECCGQVCAIDPFCCQVAWDASCAAQALAFPVCGCGGETCDDCADGNVDSCEGEPACHDCLTPVGACACVLEQPCSDLVPCPDGACPPGFVCCVNTCCFEPVCLPLCAPGGAGRAPARPLLPAGTVTSKGPRAPADVQRSRHPAR